MVDPGMSTGMASWSTGVFTSWQEDDPFEVTRTLWRACEEKEVDELVIEDFHLAASSRAKTMAGTRATLELIGALRFVAMTFDVPVYFQAPADAKSFSTNEKLKKVGFITPANPDHRRSAARHLLLRLVRNGTIDGRALLP